MPFILGSAVDKAKRGSLEHRLNTVHGLIQAEYGDKPLNFIATFEDHVLAFDASGRLRKVAYNLNENGDIEIVSDSPSRAIPVIEDDDVHRHVSDGLRSVAKKMSKGKLTQGMRTQVRELAPLVRGDGSYWMSDIVDGLTESMSDDAEWFRMYRANEERVRTSLYGRVREIEGRVPKVVYSRLSSERVKEFKKEMVESLGIIGDLFSGFVSITRGFSFGEKQEFLGAVRESLIAESQAVAGLLGKAEKLLGRERDLPLVARAHDTLADRARAMALVSEYLGVKAQSNDKE